MTEMSNKNSDNSISSTYQQKDNFWKLKGQRYRESNSVDSDRFLQETPPLLVQPRKVELKMPKCYQTHI